MLTLFGSGAGMAWLLSASPVLAAETNSLFEAYPELLDQLLGGMLFLLGILSVVYLFRVAIDSSHQNAEAMVVPILLTLSALTTAALNHLLFGLWGEITTAAFVFNSLWLLVGIWYALKFALEDIDS